MQDEEQEKLMVVHYEIVEHSELINEMVVKLEKRLDESQLEKLEPAEML